MNYLKEIFSQILMSVNPLFDGGEDEPGGGEELPDEIEFDGEKIEMDEVEDSEDSKDSDKEQPENKDKEQSDIPDAFREEYTGKSSDDMLKDLYNANKKITEQGTELSKRALEQGRSLEDVKADSNKAGKSVTKLQKEIDDLDPIVDADDIEALNGKLKTAQDSQKKLTDELYDLEIDNRLNQKLAKEHNEKFSGEAREHYKEGLGLEFEDADWKTLTEKALSLSKDGRLSSQTIEAAAVLQVEDYTGILKAQGGFDMRADLRKANGKIVPKVGGEGGGANRTKSFANLSDDGKAKVIPKMNNAQFAKYYEKIYGRKLGQ